MREVSHIWGAHLMLPVSCDPMIRNHPLNVIQSARSRFYCHNVYL